jgi:hypothetical protein
MSGDGVVTLDGVGMRCDAATVIGSVGRPAATDGGE